MADLRSGLCHGPTCQAKITDGSESEDFCSDDCQTAWNASHADPPMPSLSIHLPAPSMARWTPEGGAPITPETSTWEPRSAPEPDEEELTECRCHIVRMPPCSWCTSGGEVVRWVEEHTGQQLDSWQKTVVAQLSVAGEVGEAATQSPIGFSAMLADLDEGICIECGRLRYEHRGVNCRPPARDHRSWLSRLWRWMWLRG